MSAVSLLVSCILKQLSVSFINLLTSITIETSKLTTVIKQVRIPINQIPTYTYVTTNMRNCKCNSLERCHEIEIGSHIYKKITRKFKANYLFKKTSPALGIAVTRTTLQTYMKLTQSTPRIEKLFVDHVVNKC